MVLGGFRSFHVLVTTVRVFINEQQYPVSHKKIVLM